MSKKIRKIIAATGIRSEYALIVSLYRAISRHPRLKLELIVSGAHLSPKFGMTVREIESHGFKIAGRIKNLTADNTPYGRLKGAGMLLQGMAKILKKSKPDLLLVVGDREEAITAAIAGAYLGIPIAHIAGGDTCYGNVDDDIRHAVTKLAHIHLAMTEKSKKNILAMKEQAFRVYNTGNPGLDRYREVPKFSAQKLVERLGLGKISHPLICVIQHPLSSEYQKSFSQMQTTLKAIKTLGYQTIVVYPNSDAGSLDIIRAIKQYQKIIPNMKVFRNIAREEFVNLMRTADCLVGNSSAGILEAGFFHLPVVNVGNREKGRVHGKNVRFVPHDKKQIIRAIKKSLFDKKYLSMVKKTPHPYGDGHSVKRIVKILANIALDDKLLIKKP